MVEPVTLLVPAEERYRALAADVARNYVQSVGGSEQDGDAAAQQVSAAVAKILSGAGVGVAVEFAFRLDGEEVAIAVECGAISAMLRQSLPARKLS
jgi:hypothetical protein